MKWWAGLLLPATLLAACAEAATITVRKDGTGDYSVIQHALDVAAAGDTILIGPGEYLEHSAVRFPAWSHDIESYANVVVDNLTIIGAGAEQTIIGPETYAGDSTTASPKTITYIEDSDLRVEDLCVRNCRTGLFVQGRLFVDRCEFYDCYVNVWWEAIGSGGWIRDSQFDVVTPSFPISIDIINDGGAGDILIEDCSVRHSLTLIDGVNGVEVRNCQFSTGALGMQLYGHASAHLDNCVLSGMSAGGIELAAGSLAYCAVDNSEIGGGNVALASMGTGSRFEVTNSRLVGGTAAIILFGANSGACRVSGCDFGKGTGPAMSCRAWGAGTVHDLRNNYWGTTDDSTIQSWIIDHADDPNIGATVLYSPFAGQSVPSESTSWGDLKASFR